MTLEKNDTPQPISGLVNLIVTPMKRNPYFSEKQDCSCFTIDIQNPIFSTCLSGTTKNANGRSLSIFKHLMMFNVFDSQAELLLTTQYRYSRPQAC